VTRIALATNLSINYQRLGLTDFGYCKQTNPNPKNKIFSKVQLCLECIEWAKEEKRTFLRQTLEARLVALYFDTKKYQDALKAGDS